MALFKEIPTIFGTSATYWRIVRAGYDVVEQRASYTLAGYLSEKARTEGNMPLMEKSYEIPGVDDPDAITRESLYEHALEQPDFEGAEDV